MITAAEAPSPQEYTALIEDMMSHNESLYFWLIFYNNGSLLRIAETRLCLAPMGRK